MEGKKMKTNSQLDLINFENIYKKNKRKCMDIKIEEITNMDVAIIGIGITFPGSKTVEEIRRNLIKGLDFPAWPRLQTHFRRKAWHHRLLV